MPLILGLPTVTKGCLTYLNEVVSRSGPEIEDIVGFHRGRLGPGFFVLLLQDPLSAGDFEFQGLTMRSGGKLGLPSNNPAIENARVTVFGSLRSQVGQKGVDMLAARFAQSIPMKGDKRLVKVVPVTAHNTLMGAADQYPPSRYAALQIRLEKPKSFLVAAQIQGTVWTLQQGVVIDVNAPPRNDRPYSENPRKRVRDLLAAA